MTGAGVNLERNDFSFWGEFFRVPGQKVNKLSCRLSWLIWGYTLRSCERIILTFGIYKKKQCFFNIYI